MLTDFHISEKWKAVNISNKIGSKTKSLWVDHNTREAKSGLNIIFHKALSLNVLMCQGLSDFQIIVDGSHTIWIVWLGLPECGLFSNRLTLPENLLEMQTLSSHQTESAILGLHLTLCVATENSWGQGNTSASVAWFVISLYPVITDSNYAHTAVCPVLYILDWAPYS